MAEIKKLTKKEKYGMVLDYIQDNEMLKEFIENEINLLNKKASSTSKTSTQKENEDIKNKIYALLKDSKKQMTITEFQNTYEEFSTTKYSNQKLNALFTQLKNENKIVRIQDKKKTYFYVEVAR
jgi:hypothetical protein